MLFDRKSRRFCVRCRERWPQDARNLCRRCNRELGETRSLVALDAEALAKQQARRPARRIEPGGPRPSPIVVVKGQEFEVVWDGS